GAIGQDGDILYSRSTNGGATWSQPSPLNANAKSDVGPDSQPHLVTDGHGRWLAAWHTEDDLDGHIGFDGDILFAESLDPGATWSPPPPLNADAGSDVLRDAAPRLLADGRGGWQAYWNTAGSLFAGWARTLHDDQTVIRLSELEASTGVWDSPRLLIPDTPPPLYGFDTGLNVRCDRSGEHTSEL